MKSVMLGALLSALVFVGAAQASTVTVVGSMGGRIWYDGKDVGTVPLRLTRVPAGRHVVRVVAPGGLDRTFDLNYPQGQNVDRVVDLDVEVARREPPARIAPAPLAPEAPPTSNHDSVSRWNPARDDVRYEYVYPSGSDYYRSYDSRSYRSNYGSYPYGYNQPFYDGNYYGYGGSPGYYDTYGGVLPFVNRGGFSSGYGGHGHHHRDHDAVRSRSSAPSFGSSGSGFTAAPPAISTPVLSPAPGFQGSSIPPTFRPGGAGASVYNRSFGQATPVGQRRPDEQ